MADIVADLRPLRERGLVRIRHTELTALRRAVSLSPSALAEGPDGSGPRAIEALLCAAVANLGGGQLAAAAEHTFGLNRGGRDRPAQDRRQRAAQEYGVSQERFRKYHERVVIEQVAEEILELCQPAASRAGNATGQQELVREIRIEGRCECARFPVTVHSNRLSCCATWMWSWRRPTSTWRCRSPKAPTTTTCGRPPLPRPCIPRSRWPKRAPAVHAAAGLAGLSADRRRARRPGPGDRLRVGLGGAADS